MVVWKVTNIYRFRIERMEAERTTKSCVFINGSRSLKSSDGVHFFEEFEEAKEYATALLNKQWEKARKDMEEASDNLAVIADMQGT